MARAGGRLIRRSAAPVAPSPGELFAALSTPILAVDPQNVIVEANAAAEAFLNLGRPAIVGSKIVDMIGH